MLNPLNQLKPVHLEMLYEISKKRRISQRKLVEEYIQNEFTRLKL